MEIILCTTNKGKVKEINEILGTNSQVNFKTIDEVYSGDFDIDETGSTFYENATLKAKAGAALTKAICLADDSGIEIEGLNGRPGIYSARYLKENGLHKVLEELGDNPNRRCRFTCCLVLVDAHGKEISHIEEYWYGNITYGTRGTNGFGYDPLVVPDEFASKNLTVAELESSIKSQISHRAKAIKKLLESVKS